jgi:hypothetical protein
MKDLKWPAVAVISLLVLILGWLSYFGKDATTVLAGVIAVLGALGFGYTLNRQGEIQGEQKEIRQNTETIKEQTNGRISQLMSMIDEQNRAHRREMSAMADKLANMVPASPDPTSGAGVYADKEHIHSSDL